MADEEKKPQEAPAEKGADENNPEEGGQKKKFLFMALIILGIILVQGVLALFLVKFLSPKTAEEVEAEAREKQQELAEQNKTRVGQFTEPVSVTVNLSGVDADRFLKAAVSVEYDPEQYPGLPQELIKREQKIKNVVINILSSSTLSDLDEPVDKRKVLDEIRGRINEMIPEEKGSVSSVVFTEFVVQ